MATTIKHSGNSVYAVMTEDGPAVYPTLDDAAAAVLDGSVEVHDGDREYYEGREWLDVPADSLKAVGVVDKITLGEFAVTSIWFTSVGIPTGTTLNLYVDDETGEEFEEPMTDGVPEGFWGLEGTVNAAGDEWAWDGLGEPRDWRSNTVLAVKAVR